MAWPLIAGAAIAAIPGLVGKAPNQRQSKGFAARGADGGYDANASLYGGHQGGLEERVGGLSQASDYARDRGAVQANYRDANWSAAQAAQSRGQQQGMAMLMAQRAQGLTPSISQMQADRQMQQAGAQQMSQVASARGAGALALAQRNAAANTAAMQSGISNQAQINAANERMQAEQAAFSAYGGMRGQDMGGQQLAAGQAQFQAGLQQANRAQNDQTALGYQQLINQSQLGSLQARTQNQATLANAYAGKERIESDRETNNKQSEGLLDRLFSSDERAKVPVYPGIRSDFTSKTPIMPASIPQAAYGTPDLGTAEYLGREQARYDSLQAAHAVADKAEANEQAAGGSFFDQFAQGTKIGQSFSSGMLSDNRAKLAAAWEQGAKAGAQTAAAYAGASPAQLQEAAKDPRSAPIAKAVDQAKHAAYSEAQRDIVKANAPKKKAPAGPHPDFISAKREMEAMRARQAMDRAGIAAETQQPVAQAVQPAQRPASPFAAPAPAVAMRAAMLSDFTSKDVIDLGDIDEPVRDLGELDDPPPRRALGERAYDAGQRQIASQMDDAVAEAQMRREAMRREDKNTAKTFKRDTPADQARVKRAVEDKAGREAQGLIASMRDGAARPAAVANREAFTPDLSPAADANRTLIGSLYEYKPGMGRPGQNYGPMAQNLQANPLTASAVVPDGRSGLLTIDRDKALKLALAGVAENQRQQDDLRLALATGRRR